MKEKRNAIRPGRKGKVMESDYLFYLYYSAIIIILGIAGLVCLIMFHIDSIKHEKEIRRLQRYNLKILSGEIKLRYDEEKKCMVEVK